MKNELKELLEYISNGYSVKESAKKLHLNARTCEAWIIDLREEFYARNTTHLIGLLIVKGVISPPASRF